MRRLTLLVCACVAFAGPVRAQAIATHDKVGVGQWWEMASDNRLDLGAAKYTGPVLDGKWQRISARPALAESASVGGGTVTISTTVIIIALLVIILLLVA